MSRIKLVAIDLDGTLLDDERRMTADGAAAIGRARAQGVHVALASGRILPSLRAFAEALGISGPLICANGGHVLDGDSSELAFHSLDRDMRGLIVDFANARSLHLNAYMRTELLYLRETPWLEVYRSRVRATSPRKAADGELLSVPVSKMMLVGEASEMSDIRKEIEPKLEASLVRITESEPEYLEFLAPEANKGDALATVANALGVRQDETAAIGDYLNDVEMLEWAGFSGAVENAAEGAKAAANVVVPSNERGGVAYFIDSFVLNRQE